MQKPFLPSKGARRERRKEQREKEDVEEPLRRRGLGLYYNQP
jgi:hypothetical protein